MFAKRDSVLRAAYCFSEARALKIISLALLFIFGLLVIHCHQEYAYWMHIDTLFQREHAVRLSWERNLSNTRGLAARAVSNAAQELMWQNMEKLHIKNVPLRVSPSAQRSCPPVLDCLAPKRCSSAQASSGNSTYFYSSLESLAGAGKRYAPEVMAPYEELDFKVYVYDLPAEYNHALKQEQRRCITDQYGTEIRIHEELLRSHVLTKDPEEADFFFIPIYGECMLFKEHKINGKKGLANTNKWYLRAFNMIKYEMPYWNRTIGRDHIWPFPGARGPHIFADWKKHIRKSIFMTPEGDRALGEQFNTWKDIVIPGLEADETYHGGKLRQMDVPRTIFAFFKGTIRNRVGVGFFKLLGPHCRMSSSLSGDSAPTWGTGLGWGMGLGHGAEAGCVEMS
ncbi:Glycerol kinase [Cymbomonas tetramitiformis]|uniref:Glycerol kinase n=1 Tax=Cymbomonas tetramitiformis TaxID=36881 RepID=A0AAE0GZU3_9CHLO|nr:Glycerol kinase [Cymbomonas tetramitiformis]